MATKQPVGIATGDPLNGFRYYGPFDSTLDAVNWAKTKRNDEDWWLIPMTRPELSSTL